MGYDMRFVTTPDGEAEAVAAARKVLDAAVAERNVIPREEMGRFNFERAEASGDFDAHESYDGRTDRYRHAQDKVDAAFGEMDRAETSYFRLNIFGMGRYRELMFDLGMVFEDEPYPGFPDVEDYGTTHDDAWAADSPEDYPEEFKALTPERLEKANAYLAAQREVLSWHGKADTPGIPLHKFGSNDGWHVLPVECEAAVRIWEKFVTDHGEENARAYVEGRLKGYDYWLRWIEYLRGAARHGGFEVR